MSLISQSSFVSNEPLKQLTYNSNYKSILYYNIENSFFLYGLGFIVAIIPAVLLTSKLQNGINLSPDSLTYLYAAKGLLKEGTLIYLFGDKNLTIFPPLYPLLLALIQKLGLTGESAASLINIGSMAISSMAIYFCIIRIFKNYAIAGIFSLLIFIHPQMQGVFLYAYSEPVFIALFSGIMLMLTYLSIGNFYKISIIAGLFIGLAFLTRYGALAIIPAVILGIFSFDSASLKIKIEAILLLLLSFAIIAIPWLVRNFLEDGTLFGPRVESEDTILFALRRIAQVTTGWLSPFHFKKYLKIGLGISFLLVYGIISTLYLKRSAYKYPVLVSSFVFVITHAVLMVYTQINTVVDPIDSRYLSPLIAPIVLVLIGSCYYLAESGFFRIRPVTIVIGIGAFFLILHGIPSLQQVNKININSNLNLRSELFPAECFTSGTAVYSNEFTFLRYNEIFPQARILPRQFIYRRTIKRDDWLNFKESMKARPVYLIWLKNSSVSNPSHEDLLGGPPDGVDIEILFTNDSYNVYRSSLSKVEEI